jgi:dipeptidyl aminopeptidase/acylaminoacyl peptidase
VRAGPIGAWKARTSINAGVKPFWGEATSLHWENAGNRVQGWLLAPLGFDAKKRIRWSSSRTAARPSAADADWPTRWTALLPSQGYFVFLPNPRGSYGFGESFVQANVKDFGGGDLADILSGWTPS